MKQIFRTPVFWISFTLISLLCFAYTYKNFSQAFPIVNIDITTDREQAIDLAEQFAQTHNWGPQDPSTAISFDSDSKAQTFIELAGGGKEIFREMLKKEYYMPYNWHVRRFKEFEKNEVDIYLTPQGHLYGFKEQISEDEMRPSLAGEAALALVMQHLHNDLHIDTKPYKLIEDAKTAQQNGRVDRVFVFERTDITLNEGRYRIKAKVSGDKVTQIKQFIKIPESFTLAYKEMRSTNTAISSAAHIFSFIFYLLIGCLFGIFILMRQNWIIWSTPIKWALLIALLQFLNKLNTLPLMWMYYQTETGKYGFLLNVIVNALSSSVISFIMVSLTFIAAESLTRKAFGKHIRLWDNWNPHVANSYTVLGHTISSYLMIGIDMAFLVTFYYISTTYFQWWTPLGQLIDPNVLASYFPWLSSIADSLHAGFVEEAEYRAIPLASAALLGERFGKKRWWIFAAFILQAIIFGAAHANYAAQPAYARLVELIIPSFIFAGLYLRFGLLVSVVMHYAYDVFWFALPIFLSQAPGIRINQAIVLFCTFLPLLIVLYQRFKQGDWERLHTTAFNATWHPTGTPLLEEKDSEKTIYRNPLLSHVGLAILAGCSILTLVFAARLATNAPPLKLLRADAIELARTTLEQDGISLDGFEAYAKIKPSLNRQEDKDLTHRYIWQTYPRSIYRDLIGSYLNPPHWVVRFLKFTGSIPERAESYEVLVGARDATTQPSYGAISWQHKIAESIPGAQLEKKEARALAEKVLLNQNIQLADVYEVSAVPRQLPERIDWTFTYAHKQRNPMKEGEMRTVITLLGDQLGHYHTKIHVPETWKRQETKERSATNALQTLCNLLIRILCFLGIGLALLLWAYKRISMLTFLSCFGLFGVLYTLRLIDNWPQLIGQFNTTEPFANQVFKTYSTLAIQYILQVGIFAGLLSVIITIKQRYSYKTVLHSYATGITAGLLAAAAWTGLLIFKPSVAPLWGYYNTLGTALPYLGFVNAHVLKYLQYTVILTFGIFVLNFITDYGKKYILAAVALCVISGLCFAGFESIDLINFWLIAGSAFGILLFCLWYFLLRFSAETAPIAITTCFVLSILQQIIFNIFPNVVFVGTFSIACIIAATWFLSEHIRRLHA